MPRNRNRRPKNEQSRALVIVPQPEPEAEPSDRWGRPRSKYRPEFVDQARVLCEEGMTDKELARFFGVNKDTLYEWQFAYPEFAEAMKLGKEPADDRLERRAYEVAMGYTATVREAIKVKASDGREVVQIVEREVEIPPNPDMLRWMLKNRRPDTWRDKVEQVHSGEVVHLTLDQAKARLKAKLVELGQVGNSAAG